VNRRREVAAAAVPVLGFLVSFVVLSTSGGGELGAPPLDDLTGWADRVGTTIAAVVVVRLVALAGAGWMALMSSIRLGALAIGATRVALAAERAMPPAARSVLIWAGGLSAAGAVLMGHVATPASGAPADRPPTERLTQLPGDTEPAPGGEPTATLSVPGPEASTGESSPLLPAPEPSASMSVLPPLPSATTASPPTSVAPAEAGVQAPVVATAPSPTSTLPASAAPTGADAATWVVMPGESFWSIAEDVVEERLGRPGSEGEVARYWRQLVAANTDRLVSGNADLIFPGQRFVVP
jgi:hypothetical protein